MTTQFGDPMSTAGPPGSQPIVVRTIAIDAPADLMSLLPEDAPLTWVRRGDGLVGWGQTLRIEVGGAERFTRAEDEWHRLITQATVHDDVNLPGTGLVAFGSFAFDGRSPSGGVLVVPQVVVGRREGHSWLTTIELADAHNQPPTASLLAEHFSTLTPVRPPGTVTYSPGATSAGDWLTVVTRAVTAIRSGEVEKVVLARDEIARTENPLDPRYALSRLSAHYPTCWTFSVDGLIGATPELLVSSEKGLVVSRVLAGTIRRTGDRDADLAHAAALAHSSKDLEEHEFAVSSVAEALAPFCSSTNIPDTPFVLLLPNVLHLASDITGVLAHPGVTSLGLAAALHPTAAVCGTPTDTAREMIWQVEGMDRARYAGPVGWLGADGDGEWGIGLRSAEIDSQDRHRARIFAGCGIVAASDPEAELAESRAKLVPLRDALATD